MPLPFDPEHSEESYLVCPRCATAVRKGSEQDGSPLCRDCMATDGVTVKMNLFVVPPLKPPPISL
jgi:hypothetical protein